MRGNLKLLRLTKNSMKSEKWTTFVGVLLLLVGVALILWMARELWIFVVVGVNESIAAALATGLLVAVGAIWVKHIEHRHSVEAEFREKKIVVFNRFIGILDSAQAKEGTQEHLTEQIKKFQDDMMFWSGPQVVKAFFDFKANGRTLNASTLRTVEELAVPLENTGKLILAMRKDAGLSNRGIVRHWALRCSRATVLGAQYMVRNPDAFLTVLDKSPNTLVSDLDQAAGS